VSDGYDLITIDDYLVRIPSRTSLVRVKGDSMIDAGICEGDLLVVEQQPNANVGDIVVAIVNNEFTVKYLEREKNDFVLKPANKAYPVIRPRGGFEIFGVMAGLVRRTR
ncbi:MAG TPA: S24 family peptidase, partial [Usitatibacter sp.]|nr:S24 family peptidase [Usitatibacter sp.]